MNAKSEKTVHSIKRNNFINRLAGFTLIELMIVVAIIGILAAIAVPAYQNYITESRRSVATADLSELGTRLERFFSDNNTYAGATVGTAAGVIYPSWVPTDGPQASSYYTLVITVQNANNYTVQAQPTAGGRQAGDGTLQLMSTGAKAWDESNDSSIGGGAQTHWNW
ncbi:MAG: general secretion pathway protein GspH [Gammaproteobacteria bacterium]|nr:MAG: general secretion pathway protein GspH [Gammaproteobacteria bacterium]